MPAAWFVTVNSKLATAPVANAAFGNFFILVAYPFLIKQKRGNTGAVSSSQNFSKWIVITVLN
jgi:hypothetical protein